ncbi:hypothetical protein PR202_ga16998 [Eleusine coracana subsp. coracana]|uniref:DUF7769 domain-containing protein n=1 Tax=Eleusine coracana subsp. coracana TaxID=191504 RepID=A0AAV5CPQ3_ELECO|nr:hypothetical protein PR202_ga16998 [Eleusine coracana subsp. coracana]
MSSCTHIVFQFLGACRRKEGSDEARKQVYQTLLARRKNGRLGRNDTRHVSSQFGLHIHTVQKVWRRGKESLAQGIVVEVTSRKRGCIGHKPIPIDLEPLHRIPLNERMTLEEVSKHLEIGKARLIRYLRQGHPR